MRLSRKRFEETRPYVLTHERDLPAEEQTVWNIRLLDRPAVNSFVSKYEQCYQQKGRKRQVLNPGTFTRTENDQILSALESISNVWIEDDEGERHYDNTNDKDIMLTALSLLDSSDVSELSEACTNAQVLDEGTKKN